MGQKDSRAHQKSGREIEREDCSKYEGDAERERAGDRRCLKIASDSKYSPNTMLHIHIGDDVNMDALRPYEARVGQ